MKKITVSSFLVFVICSIRFVWEYAEGADHQEIFLRNTSTSDEVDKWTFLNGLEEELYTALPYMRNCSRYKDDGSEVAKVLAKLNTAFTSLILVSRSPNVTSYLTQKFEIHAFELIQKYKDQTIFDPTMKAQIEYFLDIDRLIVPLDCMRELSGIMKELTSMIKPYYLNFHEEITKGPINTLERDAELQVKWNSLSIELGSQIKPIIDKYFQYIDSLVPLAKPAGVHDSLSLWKYFNGYHQFYSTDELKRFWKELKAPYQQLMLYIRKDFHQLYTTYKGIEKASPMPAYIYDTIFSTHSPFRSPWQPCYTVKQIGNRLNAIYTYDKNLIQKFNPKSLCRDIEQFFESLGFLKLGKSFWENSMFTYAGNETPIIRPFYTKKKQKEELGIQVKVNINLNTYKSLVEALFNLHKEQMLNKSEHPRVLWEPMYRSFKHAFKETLIMGATSLKHMAKLGFVKADLSDIDIQSWMKGNAVRDFTMLASTMAINTWKFDVLEKKIGIKKRLKEYWTRRSMYEWVVPQTHSPIDANTSVLFDVLNGHVMMGNDLSFNQFVGYILQHQMYARFCEVAGQFNPSDPMDKKLYKCDFRNSYAAGELIRTIIEYGGTKNWRQLLDILMGTQNSTINAKGFLDYYAPLFDEIKYTVTNFEESVQRLYLQ